MARPRAYTISVLAPLFIFICAIMQIGLWISFLFSPEEGSSLVQPNKYDVSNRQPMSAILSSNKLPDILTNARSKSDLLAWNSIVPGKETNINASHTPHFLAADFATTVSFAVAIRATAINTVQPVRPKNAVAVSVVAGSTCDVYHILKSFQDVTLLQQHWEPDACVLSIANAVVLARGSVALIGSAAAPADPSNISAKLAQPSRTASAVEAVVIDAAAGFCCEDESSRHIAPTGGTPCALQAPPLTNPAWSPSTWKASVVPWKRSQKLSFIREPLSTRAHPEKSRPTIQEHAGLCLHPGVHAGATGRTPMREARRDLSPPLPPPPPPPPLPRARPVFRVGQDLGRPERAGETAVVLTFWYAATRTRARAHNTHAPLFGLRSSVRRAASASISACLSCPTRAGEGRGGEAARP